MFLHQPRLIMELLTNETIRDAIKPWDISDPESHKNYAEIAKRYGHISAWNVSAVTDMYGMFYSATAFNQDISAWNVSAVTDMGCMFYSATAFNQDISAWNVSAVTNMDYMFCRATVFNQDLSAWNISTVTDMHGMFDSATAFNHDNISAWNGSTILTTTSWFVCYWYSIKTFCMK
jgi:surface protein